MKNIHILPTEKPSRLFKFANELHLDTIPKDYYKKYNIYITSDEQPKHNDYYTTDGKEIYYCNTLNPTRNNHYKKVIITTDLDLIENGVQAIDDEFLEWFVKNPSCEVVEIEDSCLEVRVCDCVMNENCLKSGYKIIIPQEEPKQAYYEETAERLFSEEKYHTSFEILRKAFISNAKHQSERMYTYDELRQIAYNAYCKGQLDEPTEGKYNLWIQQFKSE